MKLIIGVQARTASTRLPAKIFEKLGGKTILKWVYDACIDAKRMLDNDKVFEFTDVVVLTPQHDERLKVYCAENLIPFNAPACPEDDLVFRYWLALQDSGADALIRITADCPFMQANLIFETGKLIKQYDYVSNTKERTFPEGCDVQAIKKRAMQWIYKSQKKNREHPFFDLEKDYNFEEKFSKEGFTMSSLLDMRNPILMKTSIDTQEDLERARRVNNQFMKSMK